MSSIQSLAQMTLEEKAALCTGESAWTTTPIQRLGVPRIGLRRPPRGFAAWPTSTRWLTRACQATCFPTASALASSWDVELLHEMGQALAEEASALDVDVISRPGANM
ncbi:MAG: hypothetical protein IPH95_22525 [Candidatus Promineofilum sp.]|nr:hypothetical protein [Promineifilum sp.]